MVKTMKAAGCQNWMTASRHASLASARKAALGFLDVRLVVMGDDCEFWTVSARDAGKLRKAGYETI